MFFKLSGREEVLLFDRTRGGPGKRDGAGAQHRHSVGRLDPSGAGRRRLDGILSTHTRPTFCTGLQLIHIPEEEEAEDRGRADEQGKHKRLVENMAYLCRNILSISFMLSLSHCLFLARDIIRQISLLRARGRVVLKPTLAV